MEGELRNNKHRITTYVNDSTQKSRNELNDGGDTGHGQSSSNTTTFTL